MNGGNVEAFCKSFHRQLRLLVARTDDLNGFAVYFVGARALLVLQVYEVAVYSVYQLKGSWYLYLGRAYPVIKEFVELRLRAFRIMNNEPYHK